MRKVTNLLAAMLLLLTVGCGSLHKDYVAADRATYDVVAPAVEKWLEKEPGNVCETPQDVQDWKLKLRSWGFRLAEAEKLILEEEQGQ